jgi:hypothetical protein
VQAIVGEHVSHQIRVTGAEMGYSVLTREQTVASAQAVRMPYPPAPADLWRVTYASQSHRGAFARVWAESGRYVVEITVASMDGTGPFFGRADAGADDLRAVVDRVLRETLPGSTVWHGGGERTAPSVPVPPPPTAPPAPQQSSPPSAFPESARPAPRPAPETSSEPSQRFRVALQTEGAIGTSEDSFYNHLVGARLDLRITQRMAIAAYVAYANLRGKDGRVGNILPYLMGEHRVQVVSSSDITIPLRVAIGYLPFNGPVVRLSAGVNIPLGESLELGFDIITPTFWVLPDRTAVSLDLAAELVFRL